MNRDERKRRLNEAIVNLLYPSPPQELEPVEGLIEGSGSDVISGILDDSENASTSGDEEEHDSETEKLTRAQRKKFRKKKLKEEATRRGKLIGPLLPPTQTATTQCEDKVVEDAPAVRSNASEEEGDEPACANSKKIKHRRRVKKVAKEKRVASALEKCDQSSTSSAVDGKEEDHVYACATWLPAAIRHAAWRFKLLVKIVDKAALRPHL